MNMNVRAAAKRDQGAKTVLRYAEAKGRKVRVLRSMARCGALALINNVSPNSEMALRERFCFDLLPRHDRLRRKMQLVG
jgi:hypothetical protein